LYGFSTGFSVMSEIVYWLSIAPVTHKTF